MAASASAPAVSSDCARGDLRERKQCILEFAERESQLSELGLLFLDSDCGALCFDGQAFAPSVVDIREADNHHLRAVKNSVILLGRASIRGLRW